MPLGRGATHMVTKTRWAFSLHCFYTASAFVLSMLACRPMAKGSNTHEQQIETPGSRENNARSAPAISAESIGLLRVDSTLGALRRRFPGAEDTLWEVGEGYPPHAALKFALYGLTAVASQFSDSIDPNRPAEAWMVPVGDARLPGGLRMRATWSDLRRTYGGRATLVSHALLPGIRFCSLPRLIFFLKADGDAIEVDSSGPTNIPPEAPVAAVEIIRGIVGFDVCAADRSVRKP